MNTDSIHKMISDGQNPVKSVTIMALFRNNRVYLEWLLPMLERMEKHYKSNHDIELHYAFYENDSTDVTPKVLRKFCSHPSRRQRCLCLTEKNQTKQNGFSNECGWERAGYLAILRNKLLAKMRPIGTDWLLIMDSDIYFEVTILEEMLSVKPTDKNIAMVTCNTKEVKKQDAPTGQPYVCWEHYYDTYAVVEKDDRMFYPICRFAECTACKDQRNASFLPTHHADANGCIDVRSAFAGLALVPSKLLNKKYVQWRTTEVCYGEMSLCEHVYFCDMINIASEGGRIVIVNHIRPFWRK
jgi:hypothetical protein